MSAHHALQNIQFREGVAAIRTNVVGMALATQFFQVLQRVSVQDRMNGFNFPGKSEAADCRRGFLPLGNLNELRIHDVALVNLTGHRDLEVLARALYDRGLDVRNRRAPHLPDEGSMVRSVDLLRLGSGAEQA